LQNGLDNSGDTSHFAWVGNLTSSGAAYYEHWNMRGGDWIAPLEASIEVTDLAYMSTNVPHIIDTLHVVNLIAERYKNRKCVMGLEPGVHIHYFVFVFTNHFLVLWLLQVFHAKKTFYCLCYPYIKPFLFHLQSTSPGIKFLSPY